MYKHWRQSSERTPVIYVAGASSEHERVESMALALHSFGYDVSATLHWVRSVRRGEPTRVSAADEASRNMRAVADCDLFVLLLPECGRTTVGAWVELGIALAKQKQIYVVGDAPAENVFVQLALADARNHQYMYDRGALNSLWHDAFPEGAVVA